MRDLHVRAFKALQARASLTLRASMLTFLNLTKLLDIQKERLESLRTTEANLRDTLCPSPLRPQWCSTASQAKSSSLKHAALILREDACYFHLKHSFHVEPALVEAGF